MPKRTGRKGDGGAPPLTPELQEEQDDRDIEEVVQQRLTREFKNLTGQGNRCNRAILEAGIRAKIMAEGQNSVKDLPKFELKVECTADEFKAFIKKRRQHIRNVASYCFGEKIVATPPDDLLTYNMTEMMQGGVSVFQMICIDNSGYFSLFRATPDYSKDPKKRYQKDNFLTFAGMKKQIRFSKSLFGIIVELKNYPESYSRLREVGIKEGFLETMTNKLKVLNVLNANIFDPELTIFLQLGMVLLGECPRFPEVLYFVIVNYHSPVLILISNRLYDLIHEWSSLSKVALKFFFAIIEFDLGFRDCMVSFLQARRLMHRAIKNARADFLPNFCGEDGQFCLRRLIGVYLRVLKAEKNDIIKIVMRTKHGISNVIPEFELSYEDYVIRTSFQKDEDERVVWRTGDLAEYTRWEDIKSVQMMKVMDLLLNNVPLPAEDVPIDQDPDEDGEEFPLGLFH